MRNLQLISELRRVFGSTESVDEAVEARDGCVDLKYTGSYGLRRVLSTSSAVGVT